MSLQPLIVVEGRVRKYYVITQQGRVTLQEAKRKIAELVPEVLEEADDGQLPELAPPSMRRQKKADAA